MKKRNSIASDLEHVLEGNMPFKNFYACNVGAGGRSSNQRRLMVSIDKKTATGMRIDEIDDLTCHSKIDLNPLTEWVTVAVAYFPKKNRPFRFYFRQDPAHISGAIASLLLLPDLRNHVRDDDYIASWKINTRSSTVFPGKVAESKIRNLLESELFYKSCASQVSRYLRLNNVKSKNYKVIITPVVDAEHYQVTHKQ